MLIKVAKSESAVLKVYQDDNVESPRIDFDNAGHMICFHSRYNLGDHHNFTEPKDFLISLVCQFAGTEKYKELLEKKVDNLFKDFEITSQEDGVMLKFEDAGGYTQRYDYENNEEALENWRQMKEDWCYNDGVEYLSMDEMLEIINSNAVILPLYLYDHSGITMNTTGFSCGWDSGQVGWTYMTHREVVEEYGDLNIEVAEKLLRSEVEIYDIYLRGEIYGFQLETIDGEHIDSCWGFYGLDRLEEGIKECVGEEYTSLINNLEWAS